ncbi:MAG TPA: PAS domain-containing protein [Caulobacteraceae bacterium]|jgi:hypothetical protein|nr:PAS domain-containing protein [Caulobacteraceae bacterium]
MLAQMGTSPSAARSHEELFSYWTSLREEGRLPCRAQIDPDRFKRHLPTVSLIDVRRNPRDYRLRLAGTGLYGVYGGEITGKRLQDVYSEEAADYWRVELDRIVDEGRPAVGCHSLSWRGATHLSILWIRLPLASDGKRVDMILGYDQLLGVGSDYRSSGIRAA